MQGISIFQQIYAPRVAHVVTDFDGVSHNTHSPYAIGGVVGSVGKMTAIVANDQADTWHIVNLKRGNLFDAVAVLGAFDESEAANMAMRYHGQYFDAVCGDVCESNTGGLQRFLNHPVYMRTNRPVYAEELAKLQDIPSTQAILWDGVQLKSHNGSSKHLLLDMMRCDDDKALLEKMDFVEEESKLDGEIAEYDALVVDAYKLEGTVSKLALAMDKATSISTLKVAKQTLSKPKTMRGFGVIQQLVSFELSDGQAVSIIFNVSDSEANASAKMTKDDLLVAWKYKLNSRDITAAVQPNATQNVSLNMIASRIMGLADANSEKFVAAQKKKDAMQTELADSNQQVKDLQSQEQSLLQEIADLQKQLDKKAITQSKNNPFASQHAIAQEYGYSVTSDGRILDKDGVYTNVKISIKNGEFIGAMPNGTEMFSGANGLRSLIGSYWDEKNIKLAIDYLQSIIDGTLSDDEIDVATAYDYGRDIGENNPIFVEAKRIIESKFNVVNAVANSSDLSSQRVSLTDKDVAEMPYEQYAKMVFNGQIADDRPPASVRFNEQLAYQKQLLADFNAKKVSRAKILGTPKATDKDVRDYLLKNINELEEAIATEGASDAVIRKNWEYAVKNYARQLGLEIKGKPIEDVLKDISVSTKAQQPSEPETTPTTSEPAQPVSKPPMTNPDRDYLQSIIDGALIPKESDMDTVIELAEKYENDEFITPLLEQALEVINQTQQAAVKGVV